MKFCVGVVWVNIYNCFDLVLFFGGYKESGFGCEGGLYGLEVYLSFGERWMKLNGWWKLGVG